MIPFSYSRPATIPQTLASRASHQSDQGGDSFADYFAGGTDMLQLSWV